MDKIDKWDYAPEWANYYAMDSDGRGYWYSAMPHFGGIRVWQSSINERSERATAYEAALARNSLEARPAKRPNSVEPVAARKADRDTPEEGE